MSLVELLSLKIAALLHDVPWKPWIVAVPPKSRVLVRDRGCGRLRCSCSTVLGGFVESDRVKELGLDEEPDIDLEVPCSGDVSELCWGSQANDVEACGVVELLARLLEALGFDDAAEVLRSTLKGNRYRVSRADEYSSGIDRILATWVAQKVGGDKLEQLTYVNIFDPRIAYKVQDLRGSIEKIVQSYLCNLFCVIAAVLRRARSSTRKLEPADILGLVYNILYAVLEPLWYRSAGLGVVPPAETRFPTHTVFDHLYSAAMMINAVTSPDKWAMVLVDVPSIQGFVGSGRKTRDYWAGSWLVSLLVWKAIEPVVERYGPDVVLSPYLALNPFYLNYLVDLAARIGGREAGERLSRLLSRITIAWRDEWPSQPLMPATVMLVLPQWSQELLSSIEKEFESSWRKIVAEFLGGGVDELLELLGVERGEVEIHLDDIARYVEEGRAPFRITVTEVFASQYSSTAKAMASKVIKRLCEEDALREELREVICSDKRREVLTGRLTEIFEFLVTMSWLWRRASSKGLLRADKAALNTAWIEGVTRRRYEEEKARDRLCSICGLEPAVVYRRRIEPGGERRAITGFIDEGEALCPSCLIKRLAGRCPRRVLEALGYRVSPENVRRIHVLSTHDLSDYWREVARIAMRGEVRTPMSHVELLKERLGLLCKSSKCSEELNLNLEAAKLLSTPPPIEHPRYTEYAAVLGDGDSVGSGYWKGSLGMKPDEYVKHVYYSVFKTDTQAAELHREIVERIVDILEHDLRVQGLLPGKSMITTIVNPVYVYTLSKSLMVTALLDSIAANALGATLVYAGGDDVYALSPLRSPPIRLRSAYVNLALVSLVVAYMGLYPTLDERVMELYANALVEALGLSASPHENMDRIYLGGDTGVALLLALATRMNYWGILSSFDGRGLNHGFHLLPDTAVAATVAYGRSYGVRIAHYREPLWLVYASARRFEEEKDRIAISEGNSSRSKDVTVVSRGGELYVLPNTTGAEKGLLERIRGSPLYAVNSLYSRIGPVFSRSSVYSLRTYEAEYLRHYTSLATAKEVAKLYLSALLKGARRRLRGVALQDLESMLLRLSSMRIMLESKEFLATEFLAPVLILHGSA